jgi:hypothetical protein
LAGPDLRDPDRLAAVRQMLIGSASDVSAAQAEAAIAHPGLGIPAAQLFDTTLGATPFKVWAAMPGQVVDFFIQVLGGSAYQLMTETAPIGILIPTGATLSKDNYAGDLIFSSPGGATVRIFYGVHGAPWRGSS